MVNDPIADFLVRLQNASRVHHERVTVPFSSMKHSLAELLSQEGYVGEVDRSTSGALRVELRYGAGGRPAINGVKRISKPSRRLYQGVRDIRPIKHGKGLLVLSTPAGVLSGSEARKKRVGGEILFEIW
ncbi:MAG: 30S ribosomal protein S8 [Patescibacteria group bacterium]|nr:30S ribosomal protein S8 [Patescibacteria group bacterium]